MPHPTLEQDIVRYYDDCHVDYQIVWHVNSRMAMHYGYWEPGTRRLRQALDNMNREVASMAGLEGGERVLDAGCGVGGSAFFLASQYACEVEGITLSTRQVETARANANQLQLTGKTCFSVQNFTATDFPDNHFDLVWAIESVCHAEEKRDFLREAYRVIKPGGRVIVADFFRTDDPPITDPECWMEKWAGAWAIPDFERGASFVANAREVGFENVSSRDITQQIEPSARRLYHCFIPGIICDGFLRILGKRKATNKKNVWSCMYQYKALKAGLWGYRIVLGEKLKASEE